MTDPFANMLYVVAIAEGLEAEIVTTPWWQRRRLVWWANTRNVLGEYGRESSEAPEGYPYGFTRPQCKRILRAIRAAAAADARGGR